MRSSPHQHAGGSVPRQMRDVLLALLPGLAATVYYLGPGVLANVAVAAGAAVVLEALALAARAAPWRSSLADLSVLVTAVLLALALPPAAPWWVAAAATAFAVLVAKHAFGGLGNNVFNPAMAGYAFAALSFPVAMSDWRLAVPAGGDAVSGATPLAAVATELKLMRMLSEIQASGVFGWLGARAWDTINLAFLIGGGWLLARRVVTWHIPVAFLAAVFLAAAVLRVADPDRYLSPLFHLFSGATMLGAFFIATDPVSSPVTPRGKLLFGAACGVLTIFIRGFGSSADGVAYAVLTMNTAVPLIDRITRPRTLGEQR